MSKKTKIYLLIAFSWSWIGWISAFLISQLQGNDLSFDYTIFSLWTELWGSERFLPQLLFALAVYGPLVGYLATGSYKKKNNLVGDYKNYWYFALLIPVLSSIPVIVMSIFGSYYNKEAVISTLLVTTILYFVSNLLTSGTEEFGWRGVLYPEMKPIGMSFWDIAWKGGFIWAFWHFPLMFMMYLPMGYFVLVPTLIGFVASIVAMNYISNFLYEKAQSILLVIILHALNNTMSFTVILLFPGTPFTILTSIMAWVFVAMIEKKYKNVFV